jgi:peptidoglycan/LPS O-acetylase OafA/YrhL
MNQKVFYRQELDVLRFFAFFIVFLFHFGERYIGGIALNGSGKLTGPFTEIIVAILKSGSLGVDLFFCLSSFLITSLLLRERDKNHGDFDLGNFLMRRGLRIWPLYFLFLLIFVVLAPLEYIDKTCAAFFFVFLGNWTFALWTYVPSSIVHLWSISVEEQFYVVWSLMLKFQPKWLTLRMVCVGAFIVSILAKIILILCGSHVLWFNTFARLDPIIGGVIFADIVRSGSMLISGKKRISLLAIGLTLPPAMIYIAGRSETLEGWSCLVFYPIVAICCMFLLAAVYEQDYIHFPKWLLYLGRISFGLYMFHMPMLLFWDLFLPVSTHGSIAIKLIRSISFFTCTLGVTLILAYISYEWFEKPFLRLKDKRFTTIKSIIVT